jgi:hypothetical protein
MNITPEQIEAAMLEHLAEIRSVNPAITTINFDVSHYSDIPNSMPSFRWGGHGSSGCCVVHGSSLADCVERLTAQIGSPAQRAAKIREDAARALRLAEQLEQEVAK